MQDHPGAPGTARKGITRTVVPAACGGAAAPMAPGPDHPLATTARLPGQGRPSAVPPAPDHNRSRARHKMAPGHGRPLTAQRAARHDRPRATPRAPGADVPPATTAGAPGQHRLSAVPSVPDHDRSCARHQKAPGHDRPSVAPSGAAGHDRPCATPQAPGHDVPPRRYGEGAGLWPSVRRAAGAGPPLVPPRAYGAARSRPGARRHIRAYRHRTLAGPREPAAPGTSIPHHCHSRQPHLSALPPSQPSFPRKRESMSPRWYGGTTGGRRTGNPRHVLPSTHLLAIPLHHPSRASTHHGSNRGASFTTDGRQCASCHPGTDPPVTHHGHGRLAPNPPPCPTASSLRRRPQSTSSRAAEGP